MNDAQNTPIIVGISGSSGVAIAEKTKTSLITKQINQYGYECFSIKLPQEGVKCWTD